MKHTDSKWIAITTLLLVTSVSWADPKDRAGLKSEDTPCGPNNPVHFSKLPTDVMQVVGEFQTPQEMALLSTVSSKSRHDTLVTAQKARKIKLELGKPIIQQLEVYLRNPDGTLRGKNTMLKSIDTSAVQSRSKFHYPQMEKVEVEYMAEHFPNLEHYQVHRDMGLSASMESSAKDSLAPILKRPDGTWKVKNEQIKDLDLMNAPVFKASEIKWLMDRFPKLETLSLKISVKSEEEIMQVLSNPWLQKISKKIQFSYIHPFTGIEFSRFAQTLTPFSKLESIRLPIDTTPAIELAKNNDFKGLDELASFAPKSLIVQTTKGETPAMLALESGHVEAFKVIATRAPHSLLVEGDRDNQGRLPAHLAAALGLTDFLSVIAEKAPESFMIQDYNFRSPFDVAASNEKVETFKFMVEKFPQHLKIQNQVTNPAHSAAYNGRIASLQIMAEKFPASLMMQAEGGSVPLQSALRPENIEAFKFLLEKAPQSLMVGDTSGRTPSHWAVLYHNIEALKLILIKSSESLRAQDKQGNTLAHVAAKRGNVDAFRFLAKNMPEIFSKKNNAKHLPLEELLNQNPRDYRDFNSIRTQMEAIVKKMLEESQKK